MGAGRGTGQGLAGAVARPMLRAMPQRMPRRSEDPMAARELTGPAASPQVAPPAGRVEDVATPQPEPPAVPARPAVQPATKKIPEIGGPTGPEPTRYGDWERKGRCIDF